MSSVHRTQVHDLLQLGSFVGLESDVPRPDWVEPALAAAPWVVVRRASCKENRLAVGIRGTGRDQRWGAWLDPTTIIGILSPEDLVRRLPELVQERKVIPALAQLSTLADLLSTTGWIWGPAGSVGFELASGHPTATPSSDLDVIVRCRRILPREQGAEILARMERIGVRCDVLLETPSGGVSLAEYVRVGGPVAARSATGVRLVTDPWNSGDSPS